MKRHKITTWKGNLAAMPKDDPVVQIPAEILDAIVAGAEKMLLLMLLPLEKFHQLQLSEISWMSSIKSIR